jgi:hypothetical protein
LSDADFDYLIPTPAWLKRTLDSIKKIIPIEVLTSENFDLEKFVDGSVYFWEELHRNLSEEEWLDIWHDPKRIDDYSFKGEQADFRGIDFSEEDYEKLNSRETLPIIEGEKGNSQPSEELIDVLRTTGFDEIIRPVAKAVRMIELDGSAGVWKSKEGPCKGEIHLDTSLKGARKILILIHETGHAIQGKLVNHKHGHMWLSKYAAQVALESTQHSSYASGHELINKKSDDINYFEYYIESFAEDFLLYWVNSEKLQAGRRKIFDEIMEKYMPEVDREEIRKKLPKIMGYYYGENLSESFKKRNCRTPLEFADILASLEREQNREKLKKIINKMTFEEMFRWIHVLQDRRFISGESETIEELYEGVYDGLFDLKVVNAKIKRLLALKTAEDKGLAA